MPRTRTKRGRPALADTGSARDANADGEAHLRRLIAEQLRADLDEENLSSDVEDDFVDDADSVSINTVHSSYRDDISDRSSVGPARCVVDFAANDHSENRSPEKNLLTKSSRRRRTRRGRGGTKKHTTINQRGGARWSGRGGGLDEATAKKHTTINRRGGAR